MQYGPEENQGLLEGAVDMNVNVPKRTKRSSCHWYDEPGNPSAPVCAHLAMLKKKSRKKILRCLGVMLHAFESAATRTSIFQFVRIVRKNIYQKECTVYIIN
jgi:hypothetical protein